MVDRDKSTEEDSAEAGVHSEVPCEDLADLQEVQAIQTETALEIEKRKIRDEQLDRLWDTTGISHVLMMLKGKDEIRHHVYPVERFFLEAYADPVFVPVAGKAASEREIDDLYEFVPLSPELFPDQLGIKAFGVKFKYKKNRPEGLSEREMQFPNLRAFFRDLQAVPYRSLKFRERKNADRMMVVPRGHKKRGAIIISSHPTPATGNKRINSFYPDIYRALRGLVHTIDTYTGGFTEKDFEGRSDLEVVLMLQQKSEEIIGVLKLFKDTSGEQRSALQAAISDCEMFLNRDIDKAKVEIREHYSRTKSLKDSLGRENKGALLARMQAVQKRLAFLVDKMLGITGEIDRDCKDLNVIRSAVERIFSAAHMEIDIILRSEYCKEFKEINSANTFVKSSSDRVNKKLSAMMKGVKKVREHPSLPAPFPQWAEAFRANTAAAYYLNQQIASFNGQFVPPEKLEQIHTKAVEYLIRAELVLRYQKIQSNFADLIEKILKRPNAISVKNIYEKVNYLRLLLDPPSMGVSYQYRNDIIFTDPAFNRMSLYLNQIEEKTHQWEDERRGVLALENTEQQEAGGSLGKPAEGQLEFGLIEEIAKKLLDIDRKYLEEVKKLFDECDFEPAMEAHTFDAKTRAEEILEAIAPQN